MSRYIGYRMEGHETFLLNQLLPLIAGHAKSSNTPMEVTALAALIGLATVLQSNGISRETLPTLDQTRRLRDEGRGVIVLLRDTAMQLAAPGEVSPHTLRQYGLGAQILAALGLTKITLVTNSAAPKVVGLEAYGLSITGTRAIVE